MPLKKEIVKQGAPSRYRPKLYDKITETMAGLGYTHLQMSECLGITRPTFDAWRKKFPSFNEAVISGKKDADEVVIQALYKRACGYYHPDVHISVYGGKVIKTKYMKYYPSDPTSMIFWLKNRDRDNWYDKQVLTHNVGDAEFMKETPAQIAKRMDSLTAPEPIKEIENKEDTEAEETTEE